MKISNDIPYLDRDRLSAFVIYLLFHRGISLDALRDILRDDLRDDAIDAIRDGSLMHDGRWALQHAIAEVLRGTWNAVLVEARKRHRREQEAEVLAAECCLQQGCSNFEMHKFMEYIHHEYAMIINSRGHGLATAARAMNAPKTVAEMKKVFFVWKSQNYKSGN